MKISTMTYGAKPDWSPLGEGKMLVAETDELRISLTERDGGRVGIHIDPQRGRLDIHELSGTDTQVRVSVSAVMAPSGATIAELAQRLRGIEWVGRLQADGSTRGQCPSCGRFEDEMHTSGCWLGAFLGQPSSYLAGKGK